MGQEREMKRSSGWGGWALGLILGLSGLTRSHAATAASWNEHTNNPSAFLSAASLLDVATVHDGKPARISPPFFATNVFENDRRTQVTSKNAPWTAIGRIYSPEGIPCTATLIHRNIILTAAHCVLKKGKLQDGQYRFYPGYANYKGSVNSTVSYFRWGTTDPDANRGQDWALGVLDTPLGDSVGWMGVKSMEGGDLLTPRTYYMGAYSCDFKGGEVASWEKGFAFRYFYSDSGMVLHDANMSRGASGAAMFYYGDESNPTQSSYVVAVNVAEYRNGTENSLIGIPYSDQHANIAIPSAAFFPTFLNILGR